MNIFFIDSDPAVAARWLVDSHVVKMGIEAAQMLSTAHWSLLLPDDDGRLPPYKKTHENHPCSVWVRQSLAHYRWLGVHGKEIMVEYTRRFGKRHATEDAIDWLLRFEPTKLSETRWVSDPPRCMPAQLAQATSMMTTVEAYRVFLRTQDCQQPQIFGLQTIPGVVQTDVAGLTNHSKTAKNISS